jgi:DNA-binding XRE family transcriptional regulator
VAGGAVRVAHPPESPCGGPLNRTFTRADNNLDLVRAHRTGNGGEQSQTIGGRLRRHRQKLGLTQKEAGDKIGVSESTINNWERGRTMPSPGYRDAIRGFLECGPVR